MKRINLLGLLEKVILIFCVLIFFTNGNILMKFLDIFEYLLLFFSLLYLLLKKNLKINFIFVLWLIFIIYLFIGIIYSYDTISTLKMLKIYVIFIPLLICEFDKRKMIKMIEVIEVVILIGAISIILSTIIEEMIIRYFSFFVINDPTRILVELRANSYSGLFSEKGNAAFMMNIGIGIIISKLLTFKKSSEKNIFKLIILFVALLLTSKRALLVFPVIIFGIIYMLSRNSKKIKNILKITTFGLVTLIILVQLFPILWNVFNRFITEDDNNRTELKEICIEMYDQNNLIGMGFNTYNTYAYDTNFRLYITGTKNGVWTYHAHNIYYQILGELGIIGLLFILFVFVITVYESFKILRNYEWEKNNNQDRKMLLIFSIFIQLLFILYGWTGNTFYYYQQVLIYFLAISIMFSEFNLQKKEEKTNKNSLLEKII